MPRYTLSAISLVIRETQRVNNATLRRLESEPEIVCFKFVEGDENPSHKNDNLFQFAITCV